MAHYVRLDPQTAEDIPRLENVIARALCHFLLNHLPDRGLPEACESIARMVDFYSPAPSHTLSAQGQRAEPVQVSSVYERPEFHVAEE